MPADPDLFRGTLNTILLETLSRGPMYGYQICKAVNTKTNGYFELREGSLYPALHKLEHDGLLKSFWEEPEGGRRRKYYQITDGGAKTLARKRIEWGLFADAVERVLGKMSPAGEPAPILVPVR